MLKKLIFQQQSYFLQGCGSNVEPYPAEYANADYELSDIDAQRWVVASHQTETVHFIRSDAYSARTLF